ncbi:hypothetical protein IAD21_05226 [Abditibacteriota bacterium]|nr:hypothetical protein IAD21_05226 [Abditibacteriota bacterium]
MEDDQNDPVETWGPLVGGCGCPDALILLTVGGTSLYTGVPTDETPSLFLGVILLLLAVALLWGTLSR